MTTQRGALMTQFVRRITIDIQFWLTTILTQSVVLLTRCFINISWSVRTMMTQAGSVPLARCSRLHAWGRFEPRSRIDLDSLGIHSRKNHSLVASYFIDICRFAKIDRSIWCCYIKITNRKIILKRYDRHCPSYKYNIIEWLKSYSIHLSTNTCFDSVEAIMPKYIDPFLPAEN